jgi:hypothetical protein
MKDLFSVDSLRNGPYGLARGSLHSGSDFRVRFQIDFVMFADGEIAGSDTENY